MRLVRTKTGPSCSYAARMACAVSSGSAGTMTDESVDGAGPGHVLDGVMGRPELAVGHAAADTHELHVGRAVGGVDLDLLEGAAREERRGCADERDLAAVGQPGRHPHQVLLGDAHVDDALGKGPGDLGHLRGAERIVDHGDDAGIGGHEVQERVREGVAAVVESGRHVGRHADVPRASPAGSAASSPSISASCASSSRRPARTPRRSGCGGARRPGR